MGEVNLNDDALTCMFQTVTVFLQHDQGIICIFKLSILDLISTIHISSDFVLILRKLVLGSNPNTLTGIYSKFYTNLYKLRMILLTKL